MRLKLSTALVSAALASMAAHAAVTDAMIEHEATANGDILTWGLNTQGQRYSPLRQVNTQTVGKLAPVWAFSFGGEKQRGQESQPVVHNGKMFVTASYSRIFALDATTGKKLWKYEHRLPDGIMPCCDVVNRGAALYDKLVIFATLDAQLVALDQDSGEVVWRTTRQATRPPPRRSSPMAWC
jgi:alcohol dehydrogenase (cytochrome c)